MKAKYRYGIILVGAIVLSFIDIKVENAMALINLPYTIIGDFLRYLSLLGGFGNVVAILLYLLIGLLPLGFLFYVWKKKHLSAIKGILLIAFTAMHFIGLYFAINPQILITMLNELYQNNQIDNSTVETIVLSGFLFINYILILIYLLFVIKDTKGSGVKRMLGIIVDLAILILLILAFVSDFNQFVEKLQAGTLTFASGGLATITLLFQLAIKVLTILLLVQGKEALYQLDQDDSGFTLTETVTKIYRLSFVLILVSLLFQMAINGWQLLFLSSLTDLYFTLNIPIFSIMIALIGFLLAKYFRRVDDLKEDHSLII